VLTFGVAETLTTGIVAQGIPRTRTPAPAIYPVVAVSSREAFVSQFFETIMPKSNKKPKSRAAICREFGITNPTLLQWENEGINAHDTVAMSERAARKHGGGGSEMHAARLRKLKAEARTAEMRAQEMEGRLIGIDEVEACFVRIGNVTKSLLIRLQADLPPALEGQTASRMAKIISEAVESALRAMSDPEMQHWKA
jgi:hypothetical protein